MDIWTLYYGAKYAFIFSIQSESIFFFCSVLKRDRSENLPGWMGHVLCQMVTSSGCYFLQAKAESCRWYVWEKTNWAWSGNTLACSRADFVYKPWWHGLRDDGWLTLVSPLAVTIRNQRTRNYRARIGNQSLLHWPLPRGWVWRHCFCADTKPGGAGSPHQRTNQ